MYAKIGGNIPNHNAIFKNTSIGAGRASAKRLNTIVGVNIKRNNINGGKPISI